MFSYFSCAQFNARAVLLTFWGNEFLNFFRQTSTKKLETHNFEYILTHLIKSCEQSFSFLYS